MRALSVEKCIRLPHCSQARLNRLARKGQSPPARSDAAGCLFIVPDILARPNRWPSRAASPNARPAGYHFHAARSKTGMDWSQIHDLRHDSAPELGSDGVDIDTEGVIPGHESAASTKLSRSVCL
jgi:hypothetical protein